jgi:hypothetical protein
VANSDDGGSNGEDIERENGASSGREGGREELDIFIERGRGEERSPGREMDGRRVLHGHQWRQFYGGE